MADEIWTDFDEKLLERDIQRELKAAADPRIKEKQKRDWDEIDARNETLQRRSYADGFAEIRERFNREDRRAQLAAAALQGMLASEVRTLNGQYIFWDPNGFAKTAVALADALIDELERTK